MIHIDFQGGAHGNYLEFVCNKIVGATVGSPFNSLGASHAKHYTGKKMFYADHYSFWPKPFKFDKIISIQIDTDDLLQLQQIIRKRVRFPAEKALFMFVNNKMFPITSMVGNIYDDNKDPDGFLYVTYCQENTFG